MKKLKKNLLVFAVSLTTMISLLSATNYTTTQIYAEGETIVEESNEQTEETPETNEPESSETEESSEEPAQEETQVEDEVGIETQDNGEEEIEVVDNSTPTIEDVYTFTYNDDGTATLTGLMDKNGAAAIGITTSEVVFPEDLVLPSTTEKDGVTYTVTEINFEKIYQQGYSNAKNVKTITFPGTAKTVAGNFQQFKGLQTATFSEGVEEISGNRIFGQTKVDTISLPTTLKKLSVLNFGATNLKSITLPEGVDISESYSLFSGCTLLERVELPASVTTIVGNMFYDCTNLKSVTAKSTITSVGIYAFNNCSSLTEIPDLSQVTEIGTYAFNNCTSLDVEVNLSSVTEIPNNAFKNAPVTITKFSDNLTSINGDSSTSNKAKNSATLQGVTVAANSDNTFTFPSSLSTIDFNVFKGASFPETVVIPDSVTTIGKDAFNGAKGIKTIKLGSGVTEINSGAFSNIEGLEEIIVDNSEDDISGAENFPSGVKITYLKESIDKDAGDKISDEENALTLQEAVNQANEGDVITIKKNVRLKDTLNIPSGKNITITSDGDYKILRDSSSNIKDLVNVESGASVAFKDVTLSGSYKCESVINTNGTVTLSENAVVEKGKAAKDKGVINVTGSGSLTLDGGTIQGNRMNADGSASVRVSDGATITINSGEIKNNKYNEMQNGSGTAGVLLEGNASGSMSGGTISGNTARRGAGLKLNGTDESSRTTFELKGGSITGNTNTNGSTLMQSAGGAVYVSDNSTLTMTGGEISNNIGGSGGGVTVVDWKLQNNKGEYGTAFIMNGGSITGNTANGSGGGIYSYANGVVLNAGTISNNTASSIGGGVYSEGNAEHQSKIQMNNALVTDNGATKHGGGLWFCPSGTGTIYPADGGAIYNNTATEAGDDVVAAQSNGSASLTLSDYMLGGGKVDWYKDGSVYVVGTSNELGLTSTGDGERYNESSEQVTSIEGNTTNIALKAVVSEGAISAATSSAALYITGNSATYGGGVGANGGVAIGENETTDISGTKTWIDNDNQDEVRPESITVNLLANGVKVDSKIVTEADGWSYSFTGLPTKAKGQPITYTISEETVKDYQTTYDGYNITNTYAPELTTVSGTKTWDDQNDKDGKRPDSITIHLYADDEEVDKKVVTASDGWSWTFNNLKKSKDGKEIQYTITEDEVDGYTSKVDGYNVTNTHTPTEEEKPKDKEKPKSDTKTGVSSHLIQFSLLADVSLAGAVLMLLKKRNNK